MRVFSGNFTGQKRPTLNAYEQDAAQRYACGNSNEATNTHSGRVGLLQDPHLRPCSSCTWFWKVLQNIGCGRLIKSGEYLVVQLFTNENARGGTLQ